MLSCAAQCCVVVGINTEQLQFVELCFSCSEPPSVRPCCSLGGDGVRRELAVDYLSYASHPDKKILPICRYLSWLDLLLLLEFPQTIRRQINSSSTPRSLCWSFDFNNTLQMSSLLQFYTSIHNNIFTLFLTWLSSSSFPWTDNKSARRMLNKKAW